jgi:hypothetical protein
MTRHWAVDLIGRPWAPDARGPDSFDCVGLVNWCTRRRLGVELPGLQDVAKTLWRRVDAPWRADDVVLMQGPSGRHIGFVVYAAGLGLLHADGHLTARGPVGCVVFESAKRSAFGGYHEHEFWRLAQ